MLCLWLAVILCRVRNVRLVHHRCDVARQVSLLLCRDAFIFRTCLGHNCSVKEKLEFERDEDIVENEKIFVIWVI